MLLDLGLLQAFTLVISPALLDELQDKLREKFGVLARDAAAIRVKLETVGDLIDPVVVLQVVTDDPMTTASSNAPSPAGPTISSAATGTCSSLRSTPVLQFSPHGNFLTGCNRRNQHDCHNIPDSKGSTAAATPSKGSLLTERLG